MSQRPLDQLLYDVEFPMLDYWRWKVKQWCADSTATDNEIKPTANGTTKKNTNRRPE